MIEKNSLEDIARRKNSWKWVLELILAGVLSWNVVDGIATPAFMKNKKIDFKEVNQKHYETSIKKSSWPTKPIGIAWHYTTYPRRITGYYIYKNTD